MGPQDGNERPSGLAAPSFRRKCLDSVAFPHLQAFLDSCSLQWLIAMPWCASAPPPPSPPPLSHMLCFALPVLSSQFQVKPTHSLRTTTDKLSRRAYTLRLPCLMGGGSYDAVDTIDVQAPSGAVLGGNTTVRMCGALLLTRSCQVESSCGMPCVFKFLSLLRLCRMKSALQELDVCI